MNEEILSTLRIMKNDIEDLSRQIQLGLTVTKEDIELINQVCKQVMDMHNTVIYSDYLPF